MKLPPPPPQRSCRRVHWPRQWLNHR
uniref:Uncharacterized protein n=1 Tax=Arundo donax TaxID=35708 RepID=A0A0A9GIW9_ARUDO